MPVSHGDPQSGTAILDALRHFDRKRIRRERVPRVCEKGHNFSKYGKVRELDDGAALYACECPLHLEPMNGPPADGEAERPVPVKLVVWAMRDVEGRFLSLGLLDDGSGLANWSGWPPGEVLGEGVVWSTEEPTWIQ